MSDSRSMTTMRPKSRRQFPRSAGLLAAALAALPVALVPSGAARADVAAQDNQAAPVPASTPVDVAIAQASPSRRVATIEWNPIALLIQRVSFNVEIAPADHHALVFTPMYFYPRTASFTNDSGQVVLAQTFEGFGGEIGYRYYTGAGGLRGFYAGPSVFALFPTATAGNGSKTSFSDFGLAADVGYQALVADSWLVSLGGGVQYTFTSESLARQQQPATIVANRGVQPRVDFSVGYAF